MLNIPISISQSLEIPLLRILCLDQYPIFLLRLVSLYSLYLLSIFVYIYCLSDLELVKIFSHSVGFYFVRLMISFNLGHNLPQNATETLLGIYPNGASPYHKNSFSTIFIIDLFIKARTLNNLDVPKQKNG